MISVTEAAAIVAAHCQPLATESVPLATAAGRVLAAPVHAERDQPPFDRVTMDGAAIAWQSPLPNLTSAGTQYAGDAPHTLDDANTAIEIMTGAALPRGADTIVPVERYAIDGGMLMFESGYQPERGQFVHPRGSDHPAGATLLIPGQRIGAAEVAVLASAGLDRVPVARLPRVVVIATGDELIAAGQPIEDHQVRLSNGPALLAGLRLRGYADARFEHVHDERDALTERLADLLANHDVVILSGGVSKGKADYVPDALDALGVERHFHGVAQRPGKPMWFGTGRQGQRVFALPGNPVSTLACFRRYVVPGLDALTGAERVGPATARLASDWHFKPALTALLPVVIQPDRNGTLWAAPITTNTSGDFSALAGSSGLMQLPAERADFACGESYDFYPW